MSIFNKIHKATDEAIGRWYETAGFSPGIAEAKKSLYIGRNERKEMSQALEQMTVVHVQEQENTDPMFAGFKVFYVEADSHLKAYVES